MVQNRGDIGLDKVVMKVKEKRREEKKEKKEKKKRTVCLKKPNLIRPLSHINTPRHNKPLSPEQKQKRPAGKEKSRVTDWVSDSEPVPIFLFHNGVSIFPDGLSLPQRIW